MPRIANIRLNDVRLSRRHALLVLDDGGKVEIHNQMADRQKSIPISSIARLARTRFCAMATEFLLASAFPSSMQEPCLYRMSPEEG